MFQRKRGIHSINTHFEIEEVWKIDSLFRYINVHINGRYGVMVSRFFIHRARSILFNRKRKRYFIKVWQLNEHRIYEQGMVQIKKKTSKNNSVRDDRSTLIVICVAHHSHSHRDCKVENERKIKRRRRKSMRRRTAGKNLTSIPFFSSNVEQACIAMLGVLMISIFVGCHQLWDFFSYTFSRTLLARTLKACILL